MMLSLIFAFLVLKPLFVFCNLTDPVCFLRTKDRRDIQEDKDIDCLFLLYTKDSKMKNVYFGKDLDKQLTPKSIHLIFSLYFALEEINRNPHILPNISLLVNVKCHLLADQMKPYISAKRSEDFPNYYCKNKRKYLIVLTGPMWRLSASYGPLHYISRTPELYFGHFQPLLAVHEQFPHLCQISPKDTSVALAMVSLMVYLRWNWVGVIISDDDSGIPFLSELREEMQRNIICLAFLIIITNDDTLYIKMQEKYYTQIMMSTAKVVIVYGDNVSTLQKHFFKWREEKRIRRIWVSTSQFERLTRKGEFLLDTLYGTLFYSHHNSEMSHFKQFMQTVTPSNYTSEFALVKLWWVYFNCSLSTINCKKLKNCSSETIIEWLFRHRLFGMTMSDSGYNLYNAVYAVAYSLHEMLLQNIEIGSENAGKRLEYENWQMFSILKKIQFVNPAGNVVDMKQKAKQYTEYDIFHVTDFKVHFGIKFKIGKFSGHLPNNQQLYISKEMLEWATDFTQIQPSICSIPCTPGQRKSPQEGKVVCCFECNRCAENEISNMTNMDHCVKCPDDQYANPTQTHCLKKVLTFLAYEEPLGMSLAVLVVFFSFLTAVVLVIFLKYQDTPIVKANNQVLSYVLLISLIFCFLCPLLYIGHPHKATCILQQTTFGIVFTMATSSVLAKTLTVVLAFKVTIPDRRLRWLLTSGAPNFIIPVCTVIQLFLCGIWLVTFPPFVDEDVHSEHGHILIVCNKGSIVAFHCVLGYLGSLALASFTVAFLARNLPDTFNEAKYLTFSMLVFCSVWITFLPVYQSSKGKATVTVEVFCIFASSAGLFLCIFAPKCYIILFKPQKNCFQKVRNRHCNVENIQ